MGSAAHMTRALALPAFLLLLLICYGADAAAVTSPGPFGSPEDSPVQTLSFERKLFVITTSILFFLGVVMYAARQFMK